MFDTMMDLGVEGMTISPGYPYEKAPDQEHFLHREQTNVLFRKTLANAKKRWVFNQSPLFLEYLKGNWDLECTPWGNPTYNVFGWQKPCYLLQEGYCETFQELLDTTDWNNYGRASGNPDCTDCMVHCGYEPSAVDATFGTLRGFLATARVALFGPLKDRTLLGTVPDSETERVPAPHFSPGKLVPLEDLRIDVATPDDSHRRRQPARGRSCLPWAT